MATLTASGCEELNWSDGTNKQEFIRFFFLLYWSVIESNTSHHSHNFTHGGVLTALLTLDSCFQWCYLANVNPTPPTHTHLQSDTLRGHSGTKHGWSPLPLKVPSQDSKVIPQGFNRSNSSHLVWLPAVRIRARDSHSHTDPPSHSHSDPHSHRSSATVLQWNIVKCAGISVWDGL